MFIRSIKKRFLPLSILFSTFFLLARYPEILLKPRFWAEEGAVYFPEIFNCAGIHFASIFNLHYMGYYHIIAEFAAMLSAKLFPVDFAPYGSLLISLLIELTPIMIIATSRSPFWDSYLKRILCIVAILFVPVSSESWLNTLNSQYHVCTIVFLILLEDPNFLSAIQKHLYRFLIVISNLSGVQSIFLTPLFFIKWARNRKQEFLIQGCLAGSSALIQVGAILYSMNVVIGDSKRLEDFSFANVTYATFIRNWLIPLFGFQTHTPFLLGVKSEIYHDHKVLTSLLHPGFKLAEYFVQLINSVASQSSYTNFFLSIAIFIFLCLFWYLLSRRLTKDDAIVCIGGYGLVSFFSFLGMIPPKDVSFTCVGYSFRYFITPACILMISLISCIKMSDLLETRKLMKDSLLSYLILLFCCYSILVGVDRFYRYIPADHSWPNWYDEIQIWKKNPSYEIRVWPLGEKFQWHAHLNR